MRQAMQPFDDLSQEQVYFSPSLDVYSLTQEDFEKQGKPIGSAIMAKMLKNNFYIVNIPINIIPKSGYSFNRLECRIEFCPEETNSNQRPIIYDIFPNDVHQEILSLQSYLNIVLDENLFFSTKNNNFNGEEGEIIPTAQASLTTQIASGVRLTVNPSDYRLYRNLVMARGRGNVEAFWRFDGKENIEAREIILSVVLKVSKTRFQPISAVGWVKAYHEFQWLNADLRRDLWPKVKNMFQNTPKIPITSSKKWDNITDVSLLNLNPIIAELHNPETGRLDIIKMAKLLGFSREEMTQLLECSPEDLDNDIESLQIKLYPIYLFIIQFFRLIEQRNIDIESFRILLNVPTASFFSQPTLKGYKSLRIYLLERDFKALEQFIKSL